MTGYVQFPVLLVWFLSATTAIGNNNNSSSKEFKVKCIAREREALLKLKSNLKDYHNQLSSWGSKEEDCCKWTRVGCNKKSGHVDLLDLRPKIKFDTDDDEINFYGASTSYTSFLSDKRFAAFGGEINSSLQKLRHLTHLDLSLFGGSFDPKLIGSLKELSYLNLSRCHLSGTIPPQLGNLSRLVSLDLSHNDFQNVESLAWLSHLPALKHLDMSYTNLSRAKDWLQAVNSLPSLLILLLGNCELSLIMPPPRFHVNSSSTSLSVVSLLSNGLTSSIFPWILNFNTTLVHLDLYDNQLRGPIPDDAFSRMTSLVYLDFGRNHLGGEIPNSFGNLASLDTVSLIYNNLSGELPSVLKNLSSLREIYLSNNKLNGSLTESIWLLSNLEVLDVTSNSMTGVISDAQLSKLPKLRYLVLSLNSFTLNLSSDWVPPFHLEILGMGSCKLGPHFPQWLRTQENLFDLDLSNTGISDFISHWFWELPFKLMYLDISDNQLSGEVQNLSSILYDFCSVDLSSNRFHGSIPVLPANVTTLNLSKNMFSGTVSNLCSMTGKRLTYLDLSDNFLSGELPDCWIHWKELFILDLANNNFFGSLPTSLGSLLQIQTMHLRNNSFSGELPPSIGECRQLELLDVGENKLSGKIPEWIGNSLTNLIVLRLRSNSFYGTLPLSLCHLAYIQILDLSHNNISGDIPQCLGNFTAMAREGGTVETFFHSVSYPIGSGMYYVLPYVDNVLVVWKGMELEYGTTLGLVKSFDLSSNSLSGEIPNGITSLLGLVALNLSHNELNGAIPRKIGQLRSLQSLDFSVNQLSGELPESLRDLNYLSRLNLSYNNLSGKIPISTQLQSFDNTSFMGNTELCGDPLPVKCPGENARHSFNHSSSTQDDEKDELIHRGVLYKHGSWICYRILGSLWLFVALQALETCLLPFWEPYRRFALRDSSVEYSQIEKKALELEVCIAGPAGIYGAFFR